MPGFAATDLFAIGVNASVQSSRTSETRERSETLSSIGDIACESDAYNITTEYSADYEVCSGNTVVAALGAALTAFGAVKDSKLITAVEVSLSNKAHPSFSITGHNHAVAPHTTGERDYDVSLAIAAQDGSGITMPMMVGNKQISVGVNSSVTDVTFSVELQHMETEGADGNHFDGENRTCRVDVSITGIGVENDITFGSDWAVDDNENTDSNQDSDQFTTGAHLYVDAN